MMHISSSEFKRQLGSYLANAAKQPLQIENAGRPVAIVLSPGEYAHLQQLEEQYWIARADSVRDTGEWIDHQTAVEQIAAKLREAE